MDYSFFSHEISDDYLLIVGLEHGISPDVTKEYCMQVDLLNKWGKYDHYLAWKNIGGGFVLKAKNGFTRSTSFDYTLINVCDKKRYMLFDDFFDFLAYVELHGKPTVNVITLNSIHNLYKIEDLLKSAEKVYYLLDNNEKNDIILKNLIDKGCNMVDKRYYYKGFKDLEGLLLSLKKK